MGAGRDCDVVKAVVELTARLEGRWIWIDLGRRTSCRSLGLKGQVLRLGERREAPFA